MSRRSILARASAGAAAAALPLAAANATAPVDPIFAIIAEHRAAQEAIAAAYGADDLDSEDDPNKQAAEDRGSDAELPLFITSPTTVAGIIALLEYVGSDVHEQWQGEEDYRDTVLHYAMKWPCAERKAAAHRFVAHVGAALRNVIGGTQS